MEMYKLNNEADLCGTSLKGYINLDHHKMVALFGAPLAESDGYKVSTEWIFQDYHNRVFTVYDYKETSLYDEGNPSVEEWRNSGEQEYHVGARENADEFIDWLRQRIQQ